MQRKNYARQWCVYWCDFKFRDMNGSKFRPVVVVQNDNANTLLESVVVIPCTHNLSRKGLYGPEIYTGHVNLNNPSTSVAMITGMDTISQCDLGEKIGQLNDMDIEKIKRAIKNFISI